MAIVVGTGSFLLFFSLAVNVVALMVPYWYMDDLALIKNHGLWGSCKCDWRYSSVVDAATSDDATWFKAVQWLFAAGVALLAAAMFILFVLSCCSEKAYAKAMTAAGALVLIGALAIAVSVIVFGVKGNSDWSINLDGNKRFDWGMWLGVAGFGVSLITAIVFLVQGSRM